jgi:lysophospholipid acyltransferase (LPLAT)-like uncharacterized protein
VSDRTENAFQFHSLDRFTFSQRITIRIVGLAFYVAVRIIGATLRFRTIGEEHLEKIKSEGRQPIHTFWHDRILPSTYFFRDRRIIVLSSRSVDSEYTARCIQRFGFGIVKGSSSRGAVGGLVGMIRMMKKGFPSAFTVDGPRGPRYEVKMGPVLLAQKTGNPILPFVIECKKFWQLGSWDKLQVPRPFAEAAVIFGEPIYVASKGGDGELDVKLRELQSSLDDLVRRGDEWRGTSDASGEFAGRTIGNEARAEQHEGDPNEIGEQKVP